MDEAVRDLRSSIFDPRTDLIGQSRGMRRRLLDIAAEIGDGGSAVTVRISGAIDTLVPRQLVTQVEAVVREASSNAVRHSGGSTITVSISAGESLTIDVTDDGLGNAESESRSGLRNLEQRATAHGDIFAIESCPEGGTALRWSVSLSDE